jgi:hypothetical protein
MKCQNQARYLNVFQILSNSQSVLKKKARRNQPRKEEETPTYILYAQLQECRAMLAIALACERKGFSEEKLKISDNYREEMRVRIVWLTNEITERLEKL